MDVGRRGAQQAASRLHRPLEVRTPREHPLWELDNCPKLTWGVGELQAFPGFAVLIKVFAITLACPVIPFCKQINKKDGRIY